MKKIAENRRAKYDYFLEDKLESGIKLEGWEVKSIREGKAQLSDSYVIFKGGEAFIIGSLIQPLVSASTHKSCDPTRTRKLLMSKSQILKLQESVEQKGSTCIVLDLYWNKNLVKCTVALAKGKKNIDKRAVMKDRDAGREINRAIKQVRLA